MLRVVMAGNEKDSTVSGHLSDPALSEVDLPVIATDLSIPSFLFCLHDRSSGEVWTV